MRHPKLCKSNFTNRERQISFESSRKDEYITPIVEEVNLDYARAMNSMTFDEVTRSDPVSFAFITLPIRQRRIVPRAGCVDVPEYSFNEVFDQFKVRQNQSFD